MVPHFKELCPYPQAVQGEMNPQEQFIKETPLEAVKKWHPGHGACEWRFSAKCLADWPQQVIEMSSPPSWSCGVMGYRELGTTELEDLQDTEKVSRESSLPSPPQGRPLDGPMFSQIQHESMSFSPVPLSMFARGLIVWNSPEGAHFPLWQGWSCSGAIKLAILSIFSFQRMTRTPLNNWP